MPTKELDAANTSHAKRGTHDDYRSIAYSPVVANDSGGYVRASGLGTSRHARYQLVQPRRRATTRPSGLPHRSKKVNAVNERADACVRLTDMAHGNDCASFRGRVKTYAGAVDPLPESMPTQAAVTPGRVDATS
ncbi:hypothetical protein OsI_00973 [Oryza sativa Indica Group]|uniref:Uncharacterized protein n=1 Tax=Oryza sativa subsp. indica TaxID=39946 RepID=B8AAY5_ORYSI|nr:hypothetical protein OsI_00973 [Oryza sativa Indica Group]